MRDLSTEIIPSACTLDCPDACSLEVTVTDGKVVKLEGTQLNPLTDNFICSKVRRFHRHLYGDERLRYPAVRRGVKGRKEDFERVSWDDALELLARRLRETRDQHGGEAILPLSYGGSNGYLTQDTTDARLFWRLGASRLARTVCAAPSSAAASGLYGKMPGVAFEDFVHARLIVVWGANPSASGIHLVPIIHEARRRGAKLVVVDPRRTPLAKKADLHLALRPGSDLPVALSLIRWLFDSGEADLEFLTTHATGADELKRRAEPWTFERAAEVGGIDASDIAALGRLYADSEPAVIRSGWGLERNRNGGSAMAAILALPAVAGKFGQRGGGYVMSNSGAWRLDSTPLTGEEPATREINMNQVGEALLRAEPPVKMLFVYNANPLMTLPEQEKVRTGLEREDLFTVVFDQVWTDTARYADLVLPATTFLEHHELISGYGTTALYQNAPVIEPVAEARPNFQVFGDLCHRMGLHQKGDIEKPDDFVHGLLEQSGRATEVRAALDDPGIAFPETGPTPVQFVDHFPATAGGKIHLVPGDLDHEAPGGLYHYHQDPATERAPLALISPGNNRTVSSTFGQLHRKQVPVELHPDDAAARGLTSGENVRVWNASGEVRCLLRISRDLRPGVAFLPKGIWAHNTHNGATSCALVPDTLTDIAGGACFNDARVEVERA